MLLIEKEIGLPYRYTFDYNKTVPKCTLYFMHFGRLIELPKRALFWAPKCLVLGIYWSSPSVAFRGFPTIHQNYLFWYALKSNRVPYRLAHRLAHRLAGRLTQIQLGQASNKSFKQNFISDYKYSVKHIKRRSNKRVGTFPSAWTSYVRRRHLVTNPSYFIHFLIF